MKYIITLELSLENDAEKPDLGILLAKLNCQHVMRGLKYEVRDVRVDYEIDKKIRRLKLTAEELAEALKNCE